jgi:hypothetical protein
VRPHDSPFLVTRAWSNRAALAGGDPCVPRSGNPFFTAVPWLPDTVDFFGTDQPGIQVPLGGTRVVDVDLYADDPSLVLELSVTNEAAIADTSFALDRSWGRSGETLHLTVSTPSWAHAWPERFALGVQSAFGNGAAGGGIVGH